MKRFDTEITNPVKFKKQPIKYQDAVLNIIKELEVLHNKDVYDNVDCFIDNYRDFDEYNNFYTFAVRIDNGEDFETFHFRFNYGMKLMKGEITADIGGCVEEFKMYECDKAWKDFVNGLKKFINKGE